MSPLVYLTLIRLKNNIRDLFRKPSRLIYVIVLLALLIFSIGGSSSELPAGDSYRDLTELAAMATALFLFIFLYAVWNGFSKGGTVFSLSDTT